MAIGGETAGERALNATTSVAGHEAANVAIGSSGSGVAGGVGGAAAGVGNILGVVGVSVAAGISLVTNQINYHKKVTDMIGMYRDEIAAQVGKSPDKINEKDLERVAKGDAKGSIAPNKAIGEGLAKLKRNRAVGMVITTAAILGTLTILYATGGVGALFTGASTPALLGNLALKAFVGFALHTALEKPMHWAAKKVLGTEDTTNDRISELRRQHGNGKSLSREQVVGVFVGANKELGDYVKAQFGKDYDELNVQQKRMITDSFEQHMPVTSLTDKVNAGRIKITELAYAVEGNVSGVAPDSTKDHLSVLGKVRTALNAHEKESAYAPPKRKIVEYDNPVPERSFASRVEASRSGPRTLH